jgi:hypothetical protein
MLGRRPWIYRETQRPAVPGLDVYQAVCKGDSTHFHQTAFSLFPHLHDDSLHCLDSSTTIPHTMEQVSHISTNRSGKAPTKKGAPHRCCASMTAISANGPPTLTGQGSRVTLHVLYPQGLFEDPSKLSHQVRAREVRGAEECGPWQLDTEDDVPGDQFTAGFTSKFYLPLVPGESPWVLGPHSRGREQSYGSQLTSL